MVMPCLFFKGADLFCRFASCALKGDNGVPKKTIWPKMEQDLCGLNGFALTPNFFGVGVYLFCSACYNNYIVPLFIHSILFFYLKCSLSPFSKPN